MIERPRISPLVVGAVADVLPARLRRRLEAQSELAETWTWRAEADRVEVEASPEARVTLTGSRITTLADASCTCLLAPRCLHVAAVLLRLPIDTDEVLAPAQVEVGTEATKAPANTHVQLDAGQRAAVEQMWDAATALLESGAQGAGLVLTGELLRAVHSCRLAALPRLSAAGLRVAQHVRDLHGQRPEFRLEALTWDVSELLATAHALRGADVVEAKWIGSARRAYTEVGSLRLTGLFTEPVVTASGYAGVVTYVADQNGVIWSLGDVAPGGAERCQFAYVTPVDLGDASLDHRSLCREGLHVQHATAAANRRLGTGRSVSAVRAAGSIWSEGPFRGMWATSLEVQLDRVWAAREGPIEERGAGDAFLFVRCAVEGARGNALLLNVGDLILRGIAPGAHRELAYRDNMRLLSTAPGLPLLVMGSIVFSRPRTIQLLAVACTPEAPSLELPEEWRGRVNLGLDTLQTGHIIRPSGTFHSPRGKPEDDGAVDPFDPLKRRLQQVVLGGRAALSQSTWSGFARDENVLARNHLPTAVEVLQRLREAGARVLSSESSRTRLGTAWLAGRTYVSAAEARLQRLGWLSDT